MNYRPPDPNSLPGTITDNLNITVSTLKSKLKTHLNACCYLGLQTEILSAMCNRYSYQAVAESAGHHFNFSTYIHKLHIYHYSTSFIACDRSFVQTPQWACAVKNSQQNSLLCCQSKSNVHCAILE